MSGAIDFLLTQEPAIRLGVFASVFAAMAGLELWRPRRARALPRSKRWPGNLGIAAINTLFVRLLFPTAAVGFALTAENRGWGLLHALDLPAWLKIVLAITLLDLTIYLQHVVFHAVPVLWRLHRLHHADLDTDVTTGARFHPLEIAISMVVKIAVVVALGAPAVAVLIFEILLNATSMFNHANVKLPPNLDRIMRWFVVTPDMHRVHHSILLSETNSNYGFQLPWWDRLFKTYRDQPLAGHENMTIGLDLFRDPAQLRLDRMLVQPFKSPADHVDR